MLYAEIAILLNDTARDEAARLAAQDAKAPDGDDLYSELIRRHHAVLTAAKRHAARATAAQALAALARREAKEERRRKES
jgi:hypothetical protein